MCPIPNVAQNIYISHIYNQHIYFLFCALNRRDQSYDNRQHTVDTLAGFCNDFAIIEVSTLGITDLLGFANGMQYLIDLCDTESVQIKTEMQQQRCMAHQIMTSKQVVSGRLSHYTNKIKQLDDNIQKIDDQITDLLNQRALDCKKKKKYEEEVAQTNNELSKVEDQYIEINENITKKTNALMAVERNAKLSKEFRTKLLIQSKRISINSWNTHNFIQWIWNISNGYFTQDKFVSFIDAVRNLQIDTNSTQITAQLLRTLGLKNEYDIGIFMQNYTTLMRNHN